MIRLYNYTLQHTPAENSATISFVFLSRVPFIRIFPSFFFARGMAPHWGNGSVVDEKLNSAQ